MNEKYLSLFRIPSARAIWHEYSGGIYHITFCTAHREHMFGQIKFSDSHKHVMELSLLGKYAQLQMEMVQIHCPYASIPLFAIMPDHIHALVTIDAKKTPYIRRCSTIMAQKTEKTKTMQDIANMQGWLSVVVGGLKSDISRYAHKNNIPFSWQTRFYDHIIRNENELHRTMKYIEQNVENWHIDNHGKQ